MSDKFYRAKTDSFLWKKGAVLKNSCNKGGDGGYEPISDVWDHTDHNGGEYISARIIENNPDHFERVYPVSLLTKTVYKLKEQAREMYSKEVSE